MGKTGNDIIRKIASTIKVNIFKSLPIRSSIILAGAEMKTVPTKKQQYGKEINDVTK
jgi:hypothetical protein